MALLDPRRFHALALLFMLGGSAFIFLILLMMNQFADSPARDTRVSTTEFEVARIKPPKKPIEKRVKPRKKTRTPPPSPLIDMDSSITGLDLGLPAFSLDQMGDMDESLLGNTNDLVMTSDMVDSVPQPRFRPEIDYPRRAKAREVEGYVVLSLLINREGRVEKVKVLESEPRDVFDDKAVQNVRKWIFEPARYKGRTVKIWANQTIRFKLG